MSNKIKIGILGGGIGGIVALHELSKKISEKKNCEIFLIEKEEHFLFAPSLPWVVAGYRQPHQLKRKIKTFANRNVSILYGQVENIDPQKKYVTVNNKEYLFDFILIALGAETKATEDLNNSGYNIFTSDGVQSLNEKLKNINEGKIAVLISSLPFKCPASPYETAMLIEYFIRKKRVRERTEITLYSPESFPLPVAGEKVGEAVKQLLKQKRINYLNNHQFVSAGENQLLFSNGSKYEFDLLAFTPKISSPSFLQGNPLIGNSGWIEVNKNNLETKFADVYAIGDITSIPLEMGKPLPKAGVFAHYQAEVVAHNISQKINGGKNYKSFNGYGECFVEMGDHFAGYAKGNFYASPMPNVEIKKPGYRWHWGKVWFEKYWWFKYF